MTYLTQAPGLMTVRRAGPKAISMVEDWNIVEINRFCSLREDELSVPIKDADEGVLRI